MVARVPTTWNRGKNNLEFMSFSWIPLPCGFPWAEMGSWPVGLAARLGRIRALGPGNVETSCFSVTWCFPCEGILDLPGPGKRLPFGHFPFGTQSKIKKDPALRALQGPRKGSYGLGRVSSIPMFETTSRYSLLRTRRWFFENLKQIVRYPLVEDEFLILLSSNSLTLSSCCSHDCFISVRAKFLILFNRTPWT